MHQKTYIMLRLGVSLHHFLQVLAVERRSVCSGLSCCGLFLGKCVATTPFNIWSWLSDPKVVQKQTAGQKAARVRPSRRSYVF